MHIIRDARALQKLRVLYVCVYIELYSVCFSTAKSPTQKSSAVSFVLCFNPRTPLCACFVCALCRFWPPPPGRANNSRRGARGDPAHARALALPHGRPGGTRHRLLVGGNRGNGSRGWLVVNYTSRSPPPPTPEFLFMSSFFRRIEEGGQPIV